MALGLGGNVVARAKAIIEADTKGFEKGLNDSEKRFQRHAKTIGKIGLGISTVVAYGMVKSVEAFSDFHEEVNKTEVVFGKASKSVEAFTKDSAKNLGLTRTDALRFANNFGNMLVPMGLARKEAAHMSKGLVQLSADMASFNNADPTEVLQALQSGLAGQVRPLRQYGVFLSKARIEAEAYADGIAHTTKNTRDIKDANIKVTLAQQAYNKAVKEHGPGSKQAQEATVRLDSAEKGLQKSLAGTKAQLTQKQKTLATYRIILKDTNDAQGDFARTSGGAANRSRILKAEVGNLEQEMGGALYPTVTSLMGILVKLLDVLNRHQKLAKILVGTLAAVGAGLFTLSLAVKAYTFATSEATIGTLRFMGALLTNPITLIVVALAALAVGLVEAYRHSETFRKIVNESFEKVRAIAEAVFGFIRAHWEIVLAALGLGIVPVIVKVVQNFDKIRSAVSGVVEAVKGFFSRLWGWLVDTSLNVALKVVEPFSHLPGKLGGWARKAKDAINAELDQIHPPKVDLKVTGGHFTETIKDRHGHKDVISGTLYAGPHAAGGRITVGRSDRDSVHAVLAKDEFVVTGGGEQILEGMTFPGVLNWLEGVQPKHFAAGGRVGDAMRSVGLSLGSMASGDVAGMATSPEMLAGFDESMLNAAIAMFGSGVVSEHGLVPQVLNALAYARAHGWHGSVTSGFRTYAEQAALYQRYLAGGPLAAPPGHSSHEMGQAVDVTDYPLFGEIMSSAPRGSRLYNFLGAADPVHFSVTGYRSGGRAKKKTSKSTPPKTPPSIRAREARAKGSADKKDDIKALRAEEKWILGQLRNPRLTKAQKDELRVRLAKVRASIQKAKNQEANRKLHDYSALPPKIQLELSKAKRTTDTTEDDATALSHAHSYLERQLKRKGLTDSQKAQIIDALTSIEDEQKNLVGDVDYSQVPDDLELALAYAQGTDDTGDDLIALRNIESYLTGQLAAAPDAAHKIPVVQALNDIRSQIKSITGDDTGGTGGGGGTAADVLRDRAGAAMLAAAQNYGSNIFGPSVSGGPAGQSVTVVQHFTRQPEDPFVWLKKSSFAAQAAFG